MASQILSVRGWLYRTEISKLLAWDRFMQYQRLLNGVDEFVWKTKPGIRAIPTLHKTSPIEDNRSFINNSTLRTHQYNIAIDIVFYKFISNNPCLNPRSAGAQRSASRADRVPQGEARGHLQSKTGVLIFMIPSDIRIHSFHFRFGFRNV